MRGGSGWLSHPLGHHGGGRPPFGRLWEGWTIPPPHGREKKNWWVLAIGGGRPLPWAMGWLGHPKLASLRVAEPPPQSTSRLPWGGSAKTHNFFYFYFSLIGWGWLSHLFSFSFFLILIISYNFFFYLVSLVNLSGWRVANH